MRDSARITLTEIIKEHGHGICTQPQRLKGLLLDLCGEHRREVNTLIMALSEGVVERLLQMRDAAPQVVVPSLARRLQEDLGLTAEVASWATESWGLALGVIQRPTSPGPKPVTDLSIGECPKCSGQNAAHRKFCRVCAGSLRMNCLKCAAEIPLWEDICGNCGGNQPDLVATYRLTLDRKREQAKALREQYNFIKAIELAQQIAGVVDSRLQYLTEWAKDFISDTHHEWTRQQRSASQRFSEAKSHHVTFDYSSAIQAMESIPEAMRTTDMGSLLQTIRSDRDEAHRLEKLITEGVKRGRLDGLLKAVNRAIVLLGSREDLFRLQKQLTERDTKLLQPRHTTTSAAGDLLKQATVQDLSQHRHAVGIHLGASHSCISWLNAHGQPVTIPNQEGALSTPTAVYFDGDRPIVGVEAIQHAISSPDRVVQNAKRYMGNAQKFWIIGNKRYSPIHISGLILRKLIADAQGQIGEIREAVITVPAQFSDAQRHATMLAGHAAGLERIEMINEPVAAALCHVLGNEGLAFTEFAIDQQLLVYDLGGGTLDLAIVKYKTNDVRVLASDGDLELGGLDFTKVLVDAAAEKFIADFREDPRSNRSSLQFLTLEAEQAKRSLSVRPRAAVTVQHEGHRETYQIEQTDFETLSRKLIQRSEEITRRILNDNKFGWAHIDVVVTTGGASQMPMIKESLRKLSGRTLNSSLSPEQSIAHGAAYYAGMLLRRQ